MAFWNRRRGEQRNISSGLATPAGWLGDSLGLTPAPSGQRVTIEKAMGIAPVWAAVSIISEQVGQLPLKVYRRLDSGERVEARAHRMWRVLHDKPNSHTPADRFWSTVTSQLLLWGNAFVRKSRNGFGEVDELFLLDPRRMTVAYNPEIGSKQFIFRPADGREMQRFDETEVLHIFGMSLDGIVGLSVIDTCKTALGAALARDEYEGGFYARGAHLSGGLKHPNKLSPEAATHLSESFKTLFGGSSKSGGVPVFEEGMDFVQIGSTMRDAEFVAAQQLSRTDVAVMFKLPPNYLGGSSGDSLTYSTVEQNQVAFALHAIAPWTNTIAKALSTDPEILPQGVHEAEFTLEAMMRGSAADRADFYEKMVGIKALSPDEVRAKENMPGLTQAQKDELSPPVPQQLQLPGTQEAPVDKAPANVAAFPRRN